MEKKRRIILSAGVMVIGAIAAAIFIKEKTKKSTYKIGATSVDEKITPIPHRQKAFYERFVKRVLDVICALLAFIIFFPIYISVALLVRIKLGTPILFTQDRPGEIDRKTGKETIFKLYKFRTMTDERDDQGNLLPDKDRLTPFGAWLRKTSLEGNDIIGQTTESLVNKGFLEVSRIHFFTGRDLFSKKTDLFDIEGGMNLLAVNQGQEAFRVA